MLEVDLVAMRRLVEELDYQRVNEFLIAARRRMVDA